MKKLAVVLLVAVASFCLVSSAFAGAVSPGATAKCTNAKSITIENTGGGAGDRGEGNLSVFKSSNFTTVPISLSPTAHQGFVKGAAGLGYVGLKNKHEMGQKSITLAGQTNFSRGDSIGDIGGEVRLTNTGTTNLNITCN